MGILDKFKKEKATTAKAKAVEGKTPTKKAVAKKVEPKKPEVKKETAKQAQVKKKESEIASRVLVRPMVTEKTTELSNNSKYVFEVSKRANKIDIAQAIRDLYGVEVEQVNIINVRGKRVIFRGKPGKRKNYKKAIVTLPKGQRISVFEGV